MNTRNQNGALDPETRATKNRTRKIFSTTVEPELER